MTDVRTPEFESGKAYFRPEASDEWEELGSATPRSFDSPVELRFTMPIAQVLSRATKDRDWVDITGEFDLEPGLTMSIGFPSLVDAEKWFEGRNTAKA